MMIEEAKKKLCPMTKELCQADNCMLWTYAVRDFQELKDRGFCGLK